MTARAGSVSIAVAGGLLALVPFVAMFAAMGLTPALILAAALALVAARPAAPPRAVAAALVLLLVWPALTIAWSIIPGYSARSALTVAALVLWGAAGIGAVRLPARAAVPFAFSLATVAMLAALALVGVPLLEMVYDLFNQDYPRFILKNVNRGLCAVALLVWPAALGLTRAGHSRAAVALAVCAGGTIALGESLSAQLAFVLAGVTFLLVRTRPQAARPLAAAVMIGLAAWPLVAVAGLPLLRGSAVAERLPDTARHRLEIWSFTLDRARERPWTGWGMESSRAIPGGQETIRGDWTFLPLHPHNSVLQVVLELGLVGFAFTMVGIGLLVRSWLQSARDALATGTEAAAMVAYASIGFTAFGVWQHWWIATGLLALMLCRAWRSHSLPGQE
jgi:O-antigen ligase